MVTLFLSSKSLCPHFSLQSQMPVSSLSAVVQAEKRQRSKILQNSHRTFEGIPAFISSNPVFFGKLSNVVKYSMHDVFSCKYAFFFTLNVLSLFFLLTEFS